MGSWLVSGVGAKFHARAGSDPILGLPTPPSDQTVFPRVCLFVAKPFLEEGFRAISHKPASRVRLHIREKERKKRKERYVKPSTFSCLSHLVHYKGRSQDTASFYPRGPMWGRGRERHREFGSVSLISAGIKSGKVRGTSSREAVPANTQFGGKKPEFPTFCEFGAV